MSTIRNLLIACLCAAPLVAAAQWQWLDKDGRKVYSDRPPPTDIPSKNILRSPTGSTLTAGPAEPAAAAPASASSAPGAAASEYAAKAASLAAEETKRRADACRRARDGLLVLRSGVQLKAANAKGEIETVTDAERNSEIERLQGIVATECR